MSTALTALTVPQSTALAVEPAAGDILTSPAAFRTAMQMAEVLASSPLVPQTFRGKPGDVFSAMVLARGMGEELFTVLHAVHFVNGKPGFSAQFMIARANKCGTFAGPLEFETSGEGATLAVKCSAHLAHTGKLVEKTVTMAMAKADGWTKNPKYGSLGEQMLSYRAATFLIRLYCPEILFGMRPSDELEDIAAARGEPAYSYTDSEPASPPRASRSATRTAEGVVAPVVSAGSSSSDAPQPPVPSASRAGGAAVSPELEEVLALRATHPEIVREEAKRLGLTMKSPPDKLRDLILCVRERIAIRDEDPGAEDDARELDTIAAEQVEE